jgi:hypothetical protein
MKRIIENTAAMPVLFERALGIRNCMTNEQFEREMRYRVSMSVANSMLRKRLISQAEHDAFDALMIEKYRPPIGSILLKTSVDKAPNES